jgi:hypothetical protein
MYGCFAMGKEPLTIHYL